MFGTRKIVKRLIKIYDTPFAGKHLPYALGHSILKRFSKSAYAKKYLYKRKLRSFSAFLEELNIQENGLDRQKFLVEFKRNWRCVSVSHMSKRKLDRFFIFEGYDKLQEYYNEGKGIILVGSHFGIAGITISLLPQLGYENFHTIVRSDNAATSKFADINSKLTINKIVFKKGSNANVMKSLFTARNILDSGGIIHTMGDGQQGNSNFSVRFLNKVRAFRTSFAELGVSSDAYIIPIFIMLENNGRLRVRFEDPIDKGNEQMDRSEKTRHIVNEYSRILEEVWLENPAQVNQGMVESYLRYVKVVED